MAGTDHGTHRPSRNREVAVRHPRLPLVADGRPPVDTVPSRRHRRPGERSVRERRRLGERDRASTRQAGVRGPVTVAGPDGSSVLDPARTAPLEARAGQGHERRGMVDRGPSGRPEPKRSRPRAGPSATQRVGTLPAWVRGRPRRRRAPWPGAGPTGAPVRPFARPTPPSLTGVNPLRRGARSVCRVVGAAGRGRAGGGSEAT